MMTGRIRRVIPAWLVLAISAISAMPAPASAEAPPVPPAGSRRLRVNCAAGQTVTAALARVALVPATVVVTINGVCAERVVVRRDDVILQGGAPGSGLTSPATGGGALLTLDSAGRVTLYQLTLTASGNDNGLELLRGAQAHIGNTVVEGASSPAVIMFDGALAEVFDSQVRYTSAPVAQIQVTGASLQLFGSTVEDGNGTGVGVGRAGSLFAQSSTIRNHGSTGVSVGESSSATLLESEVTGNRNGLSVSQTASLQLSGPNRVAENQQDGILVALGGALSVGGDSVIEFNGGSGVRASGGSSVQVANVSIRNNDGSGIRLGDSSVLSRAGLATITANGGWGIFCAPPPAVPQVTVGFPEDTVTDNDAGATNCPTLGTAGQVP
jgi:hypothetical protein